MATVYYDPANPATNSLTDFGKKSANDYLIARALFGIAVALIVFTALGAVLAANANKGSGGIVVDAQGTVIYPDKIPSGLQESAANAAQAGPEEEETI